MIRILSLGAGVQSTTVLLMSCLGQLPRLSAAIFADTKWEPKPVYSHLRWLKAEAIKHGVRILTVSKGTLRGDALEFHSNRGKETRRYASMPVFVKNADGSVGMVNRQCTKEYKIEPIEKLIRRKFLKLSPGQRAPKNIVIDHWFGISSDEPERAKPPGREVRKKVGTEKDLFGDEVPVYEKVWTPTRWKTHSYPLFNLRMFPDGATGDFDDGFQIVKSRTGCLQWMRDHGFPEPPRSACQGCPFHSDQEWLLMKLNDPVSFRNACRFDNEMRKRDYERKGRKVFAGLPYLHRSCVPLQDVDFGSLNPLWISDCSGVCGV